MSCTIHFPDGSRAYTGDGLTVHLNPDGTFRHAHLAIQPSRPDQPVRLDVTVPTDSRHADYAGARERQSAWNRYLFSEPAPASSPAPRSTARKPRRRRRRIHPTTPDSMKARSIV